MIEWRDPEGAEHAIAMQKDLAQQVIIADEEKPIRLIAGVDCSFDIQNDFSRAVIVLMEITELTPLFTITAHQPTRFPYVPGLLSFREIPVILEALEELPRRPDLLMVDGHGIAHPRRLGIAAHLGVVTDLPAIGVAKSRLTGSYQEPGPEKGSMSVLYNRKKEKIGTVLRSKVKTNPLFISPGHRISHEQALDVTIRCLTRYRLPEPTRIADKLSKMPKT
jgi:deoxyribonuclease V